MFKAYKTMWKYTFNFYSLERRKDFWMAILLSLIINLCLWISCFISIWMMIPTLLYSLISLLPIISMSVRRLHDVDISGKYLFFIFIPLAGFVLVLVKLASISAYDINTKIRKNDTQQNEDKNTTENTSANPSKTAQDEKSSPNTFIELETLDTDQNPNNTNKTVEKKENLEFPKDGNATIDANLNSNAE